ncbi:hypothetical protein CLV60_12355 [Dyadobacter jiangsuensis]|uniref:Uncharacterized protein n=1 Tax=Dyadobacter jiangsuensis TaxID=1591085 RepID=A0A2P8FGH1_9BACT|nr:hypothetical protein CLV60_12355 [Dyadobacter jiangsuensis]
MAEYSGYKAKNGTDQIDVKKFRLIIKHCDCTINWHLIGIESLSHDKKYLQFSDLQSFKPC